MIEPRWLYWTWALGLSLLALIHLTPVIGVLGVDSLQRLYGIRAEGPDLQLLLRHRAVLFAIVGGVAVLAVCAPSYRTLALVICWVSVASFLLLALQHSGIGPALQRVWRIDLIALATLIGLTTVALWRGQG